MLRVRGLLDEGAFVGMLGDRTPGGEATEVVEFLGEGAKFPLGPMRLAALLQRRVILMLGIYCGGNRYRVVFEQIADFSGVERKEREAAIRGAVVRYAGRLESYCREYPYNWFNFFDFWEGEGLIRRGMFALILLMSHQRVASPRRRVRPGLRSSSSCRCWRSVPRGR